MIKKEQTIQTIYNILEESSSANNFVLVRNKDYEYEMPEDERLVNLVDGETEIIDTVYGPRIDTIQLSLLIELYLNYRLPEDTNDEIEENLMSMELAKFEESIRKAIKDYDISNTYLMNLSITPSDTEKLDPENGHAIRKSSFNVLIVFDDK
tara:strand:- start:5042 stop:5497 length:456 start_codon:yes stop_codon:yes gene_type:complete